MGSSSVQALHTEYGPILPGRALMLLSHCRLSVLASVLQLIFHYTSVRILCPATLVALILICTLEVHVVMAGPEMIPHPPQ